MDGMVDVLMTSTVMKLGYAALAFGTVYVFLKMMEHTFDVASHQAWEKINDSPVAVAIFIGAIIIAGSHLIGLLWS